MLLWTRQVEAAYDHNQLYLFDAERTWEATGDGEFLEALADATDGARSVGSARGLVDLLMPRQDNFAVAVVIEGHDAEPPLDASAWDHVVEFGLAIPSGRLVLSASGGGGDAEVAIPPGSFRGRWPGTDVQGAIDWHYDDEDAGPPDSYRLQLWPSDDVAPPAAELKRHPGYPVHGA